MQGNEIESILKSCQCKCKLSEQVDKTCSTVHVWFYLSLKVSTDMNITSFLKTFNRRSSSHCKYWHTSVQQYKTFEPFHSGTSKKTILPVILYIFFKLKIQISITMWTVNLKPYLKELYKQCMVRCWIFWVY